MYSIYPISNLIYDSLITFYSLYSFNSANKAATETNLFEAFQNAATEDRTLDNNLNVATIFSSWSRQKGYPVLIVNRDYNRKAITLKQGRYLTDSSTLINPNDTSAWWIPYNYATRSKSEFNKTTPDGWLSASIPSAELLDKVEANEWVIFNKQQTGYYRVFYDEQNYQLLTQQLNSDNFTVIHRLNRAQLIDDSFEFADSGHLKAKQIFDLLSYLERETEYAPWEAASNGFAQLSRKLAGTKEFSKYQKFVAKITEKAFSKLGMQDIVGEPWLDKYTRDNIVDLACSHGSKKCLGSTYNYFQLVLSSSVWLEPNNVHLLYTNGVRQATEKEIDKLWTYFTKATNVYERNAIATGFGNAPLSIAEKYLKKTIEDLSGVKFTQSERNAVLTSVSRNGEMGLLLAVRFVSNNAEIIKKHLGSLESIATRLAHRIFSHKIHGEVSYAITKFLTIHKIHT